MRVGAARVHGDLTRAGEIRGSLLEHAGLTYRLTQYPHRVTDVTERPDGRLVVLFTNGRSRLLDPDLDSLEAQL